MLKFVALASLVFVLSHAAACAEKRTPASVNSCTAKALAAAEDEYGNDPKSTSVNPKPNGYFVVEPARDFRARSADINETKNGSSRCSSRSESFEDPSKTCAKSQLAEIDHPFYVSL